MPKIRETKNRIIVHKGETWKRYEQKYIKDFIDLHPKELTIQEFKVHDIGGRKGYTERIAVKYRNKWHTYAWSFLKTQVSKIGRTLICKDKSAYDILSKMKKEGDLKGYKVVRK